MNRSVKVPLLFGTHLLAIGIGFALGIYLLPILTAPEGPDLKMVRSTADAAQFTGNFRRDLADSDALQSPGQIVEKLTVVRKLLVDIGNR